MSLDEIAKLNERFDYEYNATGTPGAHIVDDVVTGVAAPTAFANPDNGGDTDPFTSGENIQYTVQSALDPDTYYWRVRAIDPSGSNTYGAWSSTRSFEVTAGGATDTYSLMRHVQISGGLM